MRIDWGSEQTQILFNPRLPQAEVKKWEGTLLAIASSRWSEGHFWIATSGSSGRSKWVALSYRAVLASAQGVNTHLVSDIRDRWMHVLPSFHVGGLGIWARSYLSGAEVIDLGAQWERWDPFEYIKRVKETQATLSALVPAQIFDLVQVRAMAPASLRAMIVGGGALADSLFFEAKKLGWPLLPSYGLTECASQVATADIQSIDQKVGYPDLKVLPHMEVRISDEGRIEVRSQALLTGYAMETDRGVEFIDPQNNGWFTTEDLGAWTNGSLSIHGRKGSFIKIGGESVDFTRLEKIFEQVRMEYLLRVDLVLITFPDDRLGHVIQLVSTGSGQNHQEITRCVHAFNAQVLPFERIRKTWLIEKIPRSALGKVLRAELLHQLIG